MKINAAYKLGPDQTDYPNKQAQFSGVDDGKRLTEYDFDTLKKEFGVNTLTYASTNQTNYNILVVVGQNYNIQQGKKILNEP